MMELKPDAQKHSVDVAIVGYGPVGATLANILGSRGVKISVFDKEPSIYHQPRAGHIDGEAMRVFQSVGLAKEVEERAAINAGMRFEDSKGRLLLDWPRPQTIGVDGWYPSYRIHQPFLEETLRNGVERFANVSARLRCDVFAIEQGTENVSLRYEDMTNGSIHHIQARYVVGCDGARSVVRRFMESTTDDLRSHERWVVVDVILKKPRSDLPAVTVQICDEIRPTTMIKMVGDRRRWEFMLTPDDDARMIVKDKEVQKLLSRWVDPEDVEIERAVVYTFHSVVVRGWRKNRMILAGDACHQTPPFMGQGMCAGIRDVANLGWKLCLALKNESAASLLDTYETERSPHVRKYIDTAVSLGALIQAGPRSNGRETITELAQMPQMMRSLLVALGPGLNTDHNLGGTLVPQIIFEGGEKLDDVVGSSFALLMSSDLTTQFQVHQSKRLSDAGIALISGPEVDALLERLGIGFIVMRPDRYIYEVGDRCEKLDKTLDEMSERGLI
jgi:3-(3-hydroxy-phenyl)propionate hydroxylase